MRGFLTANDGEGVCKVSIEYESPLATLSRENLITRTDNKSFIQHLNGPHTRQSTSEDDLSVSGHS